MPRHLLIAIPLLLIFTATEWYKFHSPSSCMNISSSREKVVLFLPISTALPSKISWPSSFLEARRLKQGNTVLATMCCNVCHRCRNIPKVCTTRIKAKKMMITRPNASTCSGSWLALKVPSLSSHFMIV
uniref:Secreted protein n=1 Tax=Romanomermis culicivorax TaxID=13658 RepID=A0A915IX88_ROMCU